MNRQRKDVHFSIIRPPTNFEGCKQARDRRKTGCLPSAGLHRRASPSAPPPSFYSACDVRRRRAEVAACARGIQPRFYGFLKGAHIPINRTNCIFIHLLRSLIKNSILERPDVVFGGCSWPRLVYLLVCYVLSTGNMVC